MARMSAWLSRIEGWLACAFGCDCPGCTVRRAMVVLLLAVGLVLPAFAEAQCTVYKTWTLNEKLTSPDLNNAFQRTVTANSAACATGDSANVAGMRTTVDPYPASTESLATTVAGEIERIRYQLASLVGKTYWYQTIDNSVAAGVTKHWGATFTSFYNIADPATPGAGNIALYAKNNGAGVFVLAYKDSAGNVNTLTGASTSYGASVTINLRIIRNAGTPNTKLDVTADRLSVSGFICNTFSVTVDAGTVGANGIDAGALAASTLYYVHLIYKPSTATCAGLLSLSETAPTMPALYTVKRALGAFRTNASSQLLDGIQKDDTFFYATPISVLSAGGSTTAASISLTGFVPALSVSRVLINVQCQAGNATANVIVGPISWSGTITPATAMTKGIGLGNSGWSPCPSSRDNIWVPTVNATPTTIFYASDVVTNTSNFFVLGWRIAWRE